MADFSIGIGDLRDQARRIGFAPLSSRDAHLGAHVGVLHRPMFAAVWLPGDTLAARPFHKPGAGRTARSRCRWNKRGAVSSPEPIEQTPMS